MWRCCGGGVRGGAVLSGACAGRVRGSVAPQLGWERVRESMAATFFGEVVRTPCRAGTEEEEEEEDGNRETPEDREVRRRLARKR